MKVISLVGARPQFVKEAVLHPLLKKQQIEEVLVHSGQHYDHDMNDVFFKFLSIDQPKYNLGVGSGSHAEMTGKIMIEFEKIALQEKPDWVMVYGDTDTTVAGAMVAAKLKLPVAHIEAGIRALPKKAPEEINRVMTDHISDLLLCPSQLAADNLCQENIREGVHFVGDVMYDLYLKMKRSFSTGMFDRLKLTENQFILVTLHRDYNVDNPDQLQAILEQLQKVNQTLPVVLPLHPRTKKNIESFGLKSLLENLTITQPLDYLNLMGILQHAKLVVTDSGGLQKEAYFASKRALLVMPDTGWRELTDIGWNKLVTADQLTAACTHSADTDYPPTMYGDGHAGEKIVELLAANGV